MPKTPRTGDKEEDVCSKKKRTVEEGSVAEGSGSTPATSRRRSRKKKKSKLKSTAVVVAKKDLSQDALEYLQQWSTDRTNWSFRKKTQFWLLQNMYNKKQLDKKGFKLMLQYIEGLQGNQKERVMEEAKRMLEEYEPGHSEEASVSLYQYNRAVEVLRVLS